MKNQGNIISKRELQKFMSLRWAYRNYSEDEIINDPGIDFVFKKLDCIKPKKGVIPSLTKIGQANYYYVISGNPIIRNHLPVEDFPISLSRLSIPFTTNGIWQAFLLNEATNLFLPLGWHYNYDRKNLITCTNMMKNLNNSLFSSLPNECHTRKRIDEIALSDSYLPTVEITGDKAILNYYCWSDWGGLFKVEQRVRRKGKSVYFYRPKRKNVYKFSCGILF